MSSSSHMSWTAIVEMEDFNHLCSIVILLTTGTFLYLELCYMKQVFCMSSSTAMGLVLNH